MTYQIRVEERSSFLYFLVTGENSRDNVVAYLADVTRECEARDCFRILVDEQLEGPRLPAMEVFAITSEGSLSALGIFEAIAYVDRQMGDMADFAETVAINRGMPISIFDNVEDAEQWIVRQRSGSDEKYIFLDGDAPETDDAG